MVMIMDKTFQSGFLDTLIDMRKVTQSESAPLFEDILKRNVDFEHTVIARNFKNSSLSKHKLGQIYAKSFAREVRLTSKGFVYSERLLQTDLKKQPPKSARTRKRPSLQKLPMQEPQNVLSPQHPEQQPTPLIKQTSRLNKTDPDEFDF